MRPQFCRNGLSKSIKGLVIYLLIR
jgi:hypothetical protein